MPRDSLALNIPSGYTMSNMVSTMQKAEQSPFGKQFIQLAMRWMVPFSASIKPELEILAPGHTRGRMRDRRAVRNHLSSIHAGALFTLAETTGNLALMSLTPDNGRWIVTGMDIEYQKKARGVLIAETILGGGRTGQAATRFGEKPVSSMNRVIRLPRRNIAGGFRPSDITPHRRKPTGHPFIEKQGCQLNGWVSCCFNLTSGRWAPCRWKCRTAGRPDTSGWCQ